MNKSLKVSNSIEINVSPAKMWNVITNPAIIALYLYGTETITDWKVGGDIIFQGEYEGHKYKDKGIVVENIENELLSYNYWSGFSGLEDKKENYSLVKYQIEKLSENKVKFTWIQEGYPDEEKMEHSKSGMPALLESIKKIAEAS